MKNKKNDNQALNGCLTLQPRLTRKRSYECIVNENEFKENNVLKLTIRRKKARLLEKIEETDENKIIKIENETKVNDNNIEKIKLKTADTEILIESNIISKRNFTKEEIDIYLEKCNKFGRNLDANKVYENLLKLNSKPRLKLMWNDVYKPNSLDEFGPFVKTPMNKLITWLNQWYSRYNSSSTPSTTSSVGEESDSDFETTIKKPIKTKNATKTSYRYCVICGESGSGKTSLVEAIAKQIGFHLVNIDCSTKRSGKTFEDNLIHVNNTKSLSFISSFVTKRKLETNSHSLLFFDDADVVFDDERLTFWNSIKSYIKSAKRPIILSCTDEVEMNKFINKTGSSSECLVVKLESSHRNIAVYLQLLLLTEMNVHMPINGLVMAKWMKSLYGSLNIRSLINNLQFQTVCPDFGLESKVISFPLDWEKFQRKPRKTDKLRQLSIWEASWCANNLCWIDSLMSHNENTPGPDNKSICVPRSSYRDCLYEQHYQYAHTLTPQLAELSLDQMTRVLTSCSDDITSTTAESPSCIIESKLRPRLHHIKDRFHSAGAVNRQSVYSTDYHLDRMYTLRNIALAEEQRKLDDTKQRRFRHYLSKVRYHLSESDSHDLMRMFS